MTEPDYSPELIAWVKRTTHAQGLPEKIHPDTFTARLSALFNAPDRPVSSTSTRTAHRG